MAQRLSTAAINQVRQRANKLTLENTDCGDTALSVADESLFAAHSLLYARPAPLDAASLPQEMNEFLEWANQEIETHKQRRAARIAAREAEKRARESQSSEFTTATQAYYLERLCQHLNSHDARIYWKIIARTHKAAVAKHGLQKVRRIQAAATAYAKEHARKCGAKTRETVMAGYQIAQKGFEVASLVLP